MWDDAQQCINQVLGVLHSQNLKLKFVKSFEPKKLIVMAW